MKFIADTHTHTNSCSHAYSTLLENVAAAKKAGLRFLCDTQHAPKMLDAPHFWYFKNLKIVPQIIDGVILLKGAETNIVDFDGHVDLEDSMLKELDWVIASYHPPCIEPSTKKAHTDGWLAIAENPLVDVIGHCGDARFAFEHEPVVKAFAKHGKIVEVNNHSFDIRPGSHENCRDILRLCAKHGVRAVVSSDAHFALGVGVFDNSAALLSEIDFPPELVLNADYDRFLAVAREKSGKPLI